MCIIFEWSNYCLICRPLELLFNSNSTRSGIHWKMLLTKAMQSFGFTFRQSCSISSSFSTFIPWCTFYFIFLTLTSRESNLWSLQRYIGVSFRLLLPNLLVRFWYGNWTLLLAFNYFIILLIMVNTCDMSTPLFSDDCKEYVMVNDAVILPRRIFRKFIVKPIQAIIF